eukprot:2108055-Rhodomonas_salina.1
MGILRWVVATSGLSFSVVAFFKYGLPNLTFAAIYYVILFAALLLPGEDDGQGSSGGKKGEKSAKNTSNVGRENILPRGSKRAIKPIWKAKEADTPSKAVEVR